ncbi:MAG: hypothetical protein RIQ89_1424 [Bacteroidota bacterium]|jgi:hypothetical protein
MCKQIVLEHSSEGYVMFHPKCGSFQIAFGNLVWVLTLPELNNFHLLINKRLAMASNVKQPNLKNIYLETPVSSMMMVFSTNDLHQLEQMLGKSMTIYEAKLVLDSYLQD